MRKAGEVSLVVFLLLTSLVIPSVTVGADGAGGALISVNSIELLGDGEFGTGDILLNFTLEEVLGDEVNCTYAVTLNDLDGNVLENQSLVVNLLGNASSNASHTFSSVNPGIYFLKIMILQGSAPPNSESEDFVASSNFTIQRLSPQSISVPPVAQWGFEILNGEMSPSNNETPMDGDSLEVGILISNTGDVDWTGNWRYLHLKPDSTMIEQSGTLNVNKTSVNEISLSLPQLDEGVHLLNFSILDSGDNDASDDYRIYQFEVGPPPLANLSINMSSSNLESAQIGSTVIWNISIENSGLLDFLGSLICYDRSFSNIALDEQVSVGIGETIFREMSLSAAPGVVSCEVYSEQRIDVGSSNYTQFEFDFDAAEFTLAGQSGISVLGGPWFSGDTIKFSIMILNQGNYSGTASLKLSAVNVDEDGSTISISPGSSTELFATISLSQVGKNTVSWSVQSQNGYVSEELSGELEVFVLPSQWLNVSIASINLDSEKIELDWSLELSEGHSRQVGVQIGYSSISGVETTLLEFEVQAEPGMREYQTLFDTIDDSDSFWINIQTVSWVSLGNTDVSQTIPEFSSVPSIALSAKTTPARPVSGESVELEYTIANTGQLNTGIGTLYLFDTNGMILWSKTVTEISSGSSSSEKITISSWPDGSVVDLQLVLRIDDSEIIEFGTFLSDSASSDADSLTNSIPWLNLVFGVVLAVAIILLARVGNTWINNSENTKLTSYSNKKKSKEKTAGASNNNNTGKKEVSCNSCSQKLNVPTDYSGQVRCPACKHQFDVEKEEEEEEEEEDVTEEMPEPVKVVEKNENTERIDAEENKPKEMVSSSSTDIVNCPDCESKLRVPLDKRPVKARCPACKVEFRALKD